jgi:hydrogenase expression/formation protein HypC
MCLAVPGRVVNVVEGEGLGLRCGKVDFGGVLKEVCLAYTPEATVGDYVLVHVGFALSVVDEAEAQKIFEALREMQELEELETTSEIGESSA